MIAKLVTALLLATPLAAQEPVILRTQLRPEGEAWIGERVSLYVTVWMNERPDHSPRFELPPLDGALFLRAPGSPVLGTEQLSGVEYTTQRFELMLFAQEEGALEIPSVSVRVAVAGEEYRVATEPLHLSAKRPEGSARDAQLITTSELTIDERWNPEPAGARLGDAFERTVTIHARNVMGLAIPPAPVPRIEGVATYPGEPAVEDVLRRGALSSTRTDTVTLVCERPGPVVIPALVYRWWNPEARRLEEKRLPGRSFTVEDLPAGADGVSGEAHEDRPPASARYWITGGIAAAGLLLAWLGRRRLAAAWNAWRDRRREREAAYFGRLIRACHASDPAAAWTALVSWIGRLDPARRTEGVREFALASGLPELAHESEELQRAMLDGDRAWSGTPMLAIVRRARAGALSRAAGAPDLGPLNPGA